MALYQPPALLFNSHVETIFPALIRSVKIPTYQRERISTPDDDFLDLDWLKQESKKLVVISHGLEGNTSRAYIKGMAKAFYQSGFDVLTWNFRGCSDEINRQLRFYHSGATDDLDLILSHALRTNAYNEISLIGFSLGGNLTLKYLGEKGSALHPTIRNAVTFSVPLDLHQSCLVISQPSNWIYSQRFVRNLKKKVIAKSKLRPELDTRGIDEIDNLIDFDDRYTAPIHGFKNAIDYYTRCSSIHFVENIKIPTLVVNALNDPFLDTDCYGSNALTKNDFVIFETPRRGGHVGFALFNQNGLYWSELRALDFINN